MPVGCNGLRFPQTKFFAGRPSDSLPSCAQKTVVQKGASPHVANNVIDWAYQFDIHYVDKFLLVTIADDADKSGVSRYLGSLKTVGAQCSLSARQVRRSLRRLESWGLIATYPQARPNGSDAVHLFQCRILVDPKTWAPPDGAPPAKRKGIRRAAGKPSQEAYYVNFWRDLKAHVEPKMDKQNFHTWFAPCEVLNIVNGRLTLRVKSAMFADVLRDFSKLILDAAAEISPEIKKLHFLIPNEK